MVLRNVFVNYVVATRVLMMSTLYDQAIICMAISTPYCLTKTKRISYGRSVLDVRMNQLRRL